MQTTQKSEVVTVQPAISFHTASHFFPQAHIIIAYNESI